MKEFIDYYKILGIASTASEKEIKQAYRKIAKIAHPDMTKDLYEEERQRKTELFELATKGYDILKDPNKKEKYDNIYYAYQELIERREKQKRKEQERKEKELERKLRQESAYQKYASTESFQKYGEKRPYKPKKKKNSKQHKPSILESFEEAYTETKKKEKSWQQRLEIYRTFFEEEYKDDTILTKGLVVFQCEFINSTRKLKLKKKDNIYRYTMRNRGKIALAIILASILGGSQALENTNAAFRQQTSQEETEQLATNQDIEEYITLTRTYTVQEGDTLSTLAASANCTEKEIKDKNKLTTDTITEEDTIQIPYHIPKDELENYTQISSYDGTGLVNFASLYETDLSSLIKLNPDSIISVSGGYSVISSALVTPTFLSMEYTDTKQKVKK